MKANSKRFSQTIEFTRILAFLIVVLFLVAGNAAAQTPLSPANSTSEQTNRKLIVGVIDSPPFSIQNPDGSWSGISVELWDAIAKDLKIDYELKPQTMDGLLSGLQKGEIEVGLGALTITPRREERVDFTHPISTSETGVAVRNHSETNSFSFLWRQLSRGLLSLLLGIMISLIVFGSLVWLIERRVNPKQFDRGVSGLGAGVWWAAVTMSTVGYGDKIPLSTLGRSIAVVWMLTSIVLISLFTASATSILTAARIESLIERPEDLRRVRVGAAANSSGEEYLQRERIKYVTFGSTAEAVQALDEKKIEAVVANTPLLRYLTRNEYDNRISVEQRALDVNYIGIGLGSESKLRESVNILLLQKLADEKWKETRYRYLGQED